MTEKEAGPVLILAPMVGDVPILCHRQVSHRIAQVAFYFRKNIGPYRCHKLVSGNIFCLVNHEANIVTVEMSAVADVFHTFKTSVA